MGYEKCKGIKLDKKNNKIWINVASSNVFPHTYSKCELCKNEDMSFEEKLNILILDIEFGNIHCQESMYKWTYALTRTREIFSDFWDKTQDNYTMYYTNKDKIPFSFNSDRKKVLITESDLKSGKYIEEEYCNYYYIEEEKQKDNERVSKLKEDYCDTFKKFLNEEIKGQYYLYSDNYGYIRNKGTQGSFYYNLSSPTVMDYKKAYCILHNMNNEKYGIEIKKLVDTREYIPSEEQLKEKEERLNILGVKDNTTDYKEIYDIINKFETEYNSLVYYVDKGHYFFGKCYNLFYVSNYEEEYKQDKELLKNNETYSYVYNETDSICSEIGLIGFEKITDYNKNTRLKRKY